MVSFNKEIIILSEDYTQETGPLPHNHDEHFGYALTSSFEDDGDCFMGEDSFAARFDKHALQAGIDRNKQALATLQTSPNDPDANYMMYVAYQNGYGGYERNKDRAAQYLRIAARYGHKDAQLMLTREESERSAVSEAKEMDIERQHAAQALFENKAALDKAIESKILPSIVRIKADEKVGTGFFQHPEWMVSNAHVLPTRDILDASELIGGSGQSSKLEVVDAYIRSQNRHISPDITITHAKSKGRQPCLPTQFEDGSDGLLKDKSVFFYVHYSAATKKPNIVFLDALLPRDSDILLFQTENNVVPENGASGAPIIEARILLGRKPSWIFKTVGILYARCNGKWYNQESGRQAVSESSKLVCGTPLSQDFRDILQILFERESSIRSAKTGELAESAIKDPAVAAHYKEKAKEESKRVKDYLQAYESGESSRLNLPLPDGLERLFRRWNNGDRYGQRPEHPGTPIYNVPQGYANHHVIPIPDLLFLWDFLHALPCEQEKHIRKQVKESWGSALKEKEAKIRADFSEYPSDEKGKMIKRGMAEFMGTKGDWLKNEYDRLKAQAVNERYGKFHTVLEVLCQPNNLCRRSFAWGGWNLFQGPQATRGDDPEHGQNRHDRSEKIKPHNFNQQQWNLLKDQKEGLYTRIQALKKLNKPDEKESEKLYTALSNISNFWRKRPEGEKVPYPYRVDDWSPADKHGKVSLKVS